MDVFPVLILAALCVAAPVLGAWPAGLRVRFDFGLHIGTDFFMEMPRTVAEAKTKRMEQMVRPAGPMPSLSMYCTGDRIFCCMFDDLEYLAGLQVGMPVQNITNSITDWITEGWTLWTVDTADGDTIDLQTMQQYFVNEEILAMDADERLAAYEADKPLPYGGVWVTSFNHELLFVPSSREDIDKTIFTEQACVPWMGRHFYYNMTADTPCRSDTLLPWFLLEASGELIGMGLMATGVLAPTSRKDYFEKPTRSAIELIVPRGPECVYERGDNPGMITMHIYYINNPWLLTCILQ